MEGVYKREALLYVVQVDHLTGGECGPVDRSVLRGRRLECAGGLRGHEKEPAVIYVFYGGWHKIRTDHC